MSRTKRNIDVTKWDLVSPVRNIQRLTGHKKGAGHRNSGKYLVGPGGLNCPCCTKLPPDELKVKERRLIRRKTKVQDHLDSQTNQE